MNQRLQAAGGTLLLLAGTAILMAVITAEAVSYTHLTLPTIYSV